MKRTLLGKYDIIGIYPICNAKAFFVLPRDIAAIWEEKKGTDAIALIWEGKLYFRKIYYRRNGACFKFFNHIIYMGDIMACNEVISID